MSEYTIDKFTYNGNTYNLAGGGGSTIGFVDANSSLSDVISTCQNNDFVFYATSDTSYLPLLYYGAESGDEYAGFGIIAPINDPGKYGETAGELYYIDVNSDGWVQSESFLYESVGYVYYGETTYSDALDIIDKHDITYCVYTTGTSPKTITYYYPLTYFDDGYDTIGFSLPDSLSPDVNKIEIKELSLNSDNYWDTGTRTCVSNIKQTFYGTCATIASTATKVVTCAGFSLNSGTIIGIRFRFGNTTNAPKLNINSTGEKDILIGDTYVGSSNVLKWSDYAVIYFMYDGTYFKYMCSVASSSQEQPRGANTWYGTSSTTASTTAKTSTIANYVLTQGAVVNITFTTGNTADALTLNVNSTGAKAIYYNNAVTSSSNKLTWDANETLTFVYTGSYYYFLSKSGLPDIPDVSGKIDTAGTGLSKSGTTLNHSNSVTAQTTQAVYPIKIDAQGHISAYGSAVNLEEMKVFIVTLTAGSSDSYQSDKTAKQIYDAFNAGRVVLAYVDGSYILLSSVWGQDNYYQADFYKSVASTGSFHVYEYIITTDNNGTSVEYSHYPTYVNNATLTIQKNGTTVNSFTANASSNVTANITVPTKVSDLTNDSGFVTTDEKVKTAAVTSGTTYFPVVGSSSISAETKKVDLTGLAYVGTSGTSSADGSSILVLGNATASGTSGNKEGRIRLWGTGDDSAVIAAGALTDTRTITLPDASGTIALTSDITDEKVKNTKIDPSYPAVTYYLSGSQSSSTATEELVKSDVVSVSLVQLTQSANIAELTLGKINSTGTMGCIRLCGVNGNNTLIQPSSVSSFTQIDLPDTTGTLALTSDIPTDRTKVQIVRW